jgi:glyoxylase-like metal-dependent hydrolase (beta-lactamase superfamily II)
VAVTDTTLETPGAADADRLYFRQLLSGRDFAREDQVARQMVNFVYLIGDRQTGEALIVDPAYAVDDLLGILAADGMACVGALATHYHPDHVGGDMMGWGVEGITRLLEVAPVPVHVQEDEAPWVARSTGVGAGELVTHRGGDVVQVGSVPVTLVHTPGHTPGSQCFLVDGKLVAGDTLFLDGCGRTDLPGGDPEALYESLTTRLARVPDETVLYPGHLYSPEPSATMGQTRASNYVFRLRTPEQWMTMFGS